MISGKNFLIIVPIKARVNILARLKERVPSVETK